MTAFRELWEYRSLIYNLAQRELRARYKKSILGWTWSLINPAATLMIYWVVFGYFLAQQPPVGWNGTLYNFGLYLFAALIIWNFFNATVQGSIGVLMSSGPLLNKVYFPPACPVVANMLTVLIQTAIETGILVVIMLLIGNLTWLVLLFPVVVLFLALYATGMGMFFSIYNVYYRDVTHFVGIAMNLMFYATPIIYTISPAWPSWVRAAIRINPLTEFTELSRYFFYGPLPYETRWWYYAAAGLGAVLTFVVGWSVFNRKSLTVSEEL